MIRLIVNADDFGFTRDVNAGIVEAHRNGILRATTLMANGDAFEDAIDLARQNPSLDVGVHLTLVQGRSVLDPSRPLPATLQELITALIRRELPVYEEAAAQVRRIVAAGIQPSHIDTHKHTHMLPPVLDAVARVAREFEIHWVRRPFDFGIDTGARVLKRGVALGMRLMRPWFASALNGLRTTDYFTGFQITGTLDEGSLARTLEKLPEGLTEFMCHPGHLGPELRHAATRLKESREIELAALCSPVTRQVIGKRGIQLIDYREAAGGAPLAPGV
ncbi:MAG TPA: ChbG/HpnK family deacetylase [Bryobacteraceae bacterium]|nr:ChbG/HpnK family deacetylase [Bryobacteraceae bacterium]